MISLKTFNEGHKLWIYSLQFTFSFFLSFPVLMLLPRSHVHIFYSASCSQMSSVYGLYVMAKTNVHTSISIWLKSNLCGCPWTSSFVWLSRCELRLHIHYVDSLHYEDERSKGELHEAASTIRMPARSVTTSDILQYEERAKGIVAQKHTQYNWSFVV